MKPIVFDSSSLISLSSSCLFNGIGRMLEGMGAQGVISSAVEFEAVIYPLRIKRLELNAIRIKHGIRKGWLRVVELDQTMKKDVEKAMELANNCFYGSKGNISLLHEGEVEALVLAESLSAKVLAVDERTTRMLIEEPERLRRLIGRRQNSNIKKNQKFIEKITERFRGISFIRSSELAALAFERGFLREEIGPGKKGLEAALYSLKYKGCAVSSAEIEKFLGGRQ